MNARDKATALRRATLQTLAAIAARGGAFHDAIGLDWEGGSLASHVAGWDPMIRAAACASYAEACARAAFAIEADDASGTMRGYRLIRLGGGPSKTGHTYSGETFRTADDLWIAMRTAEDLATHPACKDPSPPRLPSPVRGSTLHVRGIRWFDSRNGNTYHRATAILDGITIADVPFSYGYGDHFVDTAAEAIEAAGILTRERHANGSREPLRVACDRLGIVLSVDVRDVKRRRDLGSSRSEVRS